MAHPSFLGQNSSSPAEDKVERLQAMSQYTVLRCARGLAARMPTSLADRGLESSASCLLKFPVRCRGIMASLGDGLGLSSVSQDAAHPSGFGNEKTGGLQLDAKNVFNWLRVLSMEVTC